MASLTLSSPPAPDVPNLKHLPNSLLHQSHLCPRTDNMKRDITSPDLEPRSDAACKVRPTSPSILLCPRHGTYGPDKPFSLHMSRLIKYGKLACVLTAFTTPQAAWNGIKPVNPTSYCRAAG
ncbi:hypothetical protein E4U42_007378 [Claviceps africana]|uniref:Uncharacterized protein n=1 Tax=Claviceps africana TaxID=83212 RepID=A0A8K0NIL1_9HYPO|nr:hypothetical protein E4U42_007378 [Claviceps africana]